MVALILVGSSTFCRGDSKAYKVRDSNEEYANPAHTKEYARSFAPDDSSGAFYGAGFHFPDFFNDGNKDGEAGDFGVGPSFGSPFPGLLESRSSDSSYIVPAGTYRTAYDVRPKSPVSRGHTPPARGEYRQKNPILTLYDDWSPDEQPRHRWSPDQPRNSKWSQEHTDDESGEASSSVAPYSGKLSGPYRGTGSHSRPYSEASLKQHYKPINPPGNTHLRGEGEFRTHAHKYGVNHVYDRKKKPEEPNYDEYDENLNNRKPQQFSSDPNPHRNEKPYRHNRPSQYRSQTYPKEYRSQTKPNEYRQSYPREFRDRNFSPSQPDFFKNTRNFDFFTDSSNTAPTKVKAVDSESSDDPESSEDSERKNDQLDKSCEKSNKTTTINSSDGKISVQCYDCYDVNYKRPYEQCVEVPDENGRSHRKKRSVKSGNVAQAVPPARGKRQHDDDYYDGDGNYGPDSSDYRFGPEHFADDYPTSYDDGEDEVSPEYESEKCHKSRKGDMLCISCENKNTGGTYQQCSYASDPKKNSYERSVSKVFGSPRLTDENRRKQVEGVPRKAYLSKRKPHSARGAGSIDPSGPSDYPRGTSSYSSGASGYDDGTFRKAPAKKKVSGGSLGSNGQTSRYRGSQGRLPLPPPARGIPRDRSLTKTPASTSLKGPSRMGLESNLKTTGKSSYLPKRNPPPSSRAYSTPSPVGPDPYSYDLPDPYNPDLGNIGAARGSQNRKNIDASYEPGYDETFADLFPELLDTDPTSAVALAPPSYDEYPEAYTDYEDVPVRRRDQDSIQNGSKIHSTPSTAQLPQKTSNPKSEPKKQRICKRTRKNKMTCLQCVDEKGAKQEECSYGTDPKSKHTTYRQVKEMRYEPSRQHLVGSPEDTDRSKRKHKKYNPEERYTTKNTNMGQKVDRSSDRNDRQNNTFTPPGRNSPSRLHPETREKREDIESPEEKTNAEIDTSTRKNYNPIPTDPPELDDFGEKMSEDGEFSADTEMKFDPVLGMSLPKYMLEKSEGEAIFDEVLGSSYKDE